MQVIGFNFTKILTERALQLTNFTLNTNIEFKNLEKEKVELLKDNKAIKLTFKYTVEYSNSEEKKKDEKLAEILFEGHIVFAVSKEEEKDLLKSWKKKRIPQNVQIPLFNLILKKCSPKAVYLADELGLPSPVPLPRIQPKPKEEN